jgi:hypothetical protein
MVEVGAQRLEYETPLVVGDIQPFVSPIDGTVIGSRSTMRRYMKQHDLVHVDDGGSHAKKARERRRQALQGTLPEQKRDRIRVLSDAYEHARNQARARSGR